VGRARCGPRNARRGTPIPMMILLVLQDPSGRAEERVRFPRCRMDFRRLSRNGLLPNLLWYLVVSLGQQLDPPGPPQHHSESAVEHEVCQGPAEHLVLGVVVPPLEVGHLDDERLDQGNRKGIAGVSGFGRWRTYSGTWPRRWQMPWDQRDLSRRSPLRSCQLENSCKDIGDGGGDGGD
jgi:hypothetical protein